MTLRGQDFKRSGRYGGYRPGDCGAPATRATSGTRSTDPTRRSPKAAGRGPYPSAPGLGGCYNTQPVQTADPQLTVHHRSIVMPHAAGADRMECRLGVFSNERRQRRIIDLAGPRSHGGADVRAQGCGFAQVLGDAQASKKATQVRLGREVARVDERRLRRIRTGKANVTAAVRLQEPTPTVSPWPGGGVRPSPSSGTGSQSSSMQGRPEPGRCGRRRPPRSRWR